MQSKKLVGPFKSAPNVQQENNVVGVQDPNVLKVNDIVELIKEDDFQKYGIPPYQVEVSGDLCEYVAYQAIESFGAQFCYGISTEPVSNWVNGDKAILPKMYRCAGGGDRQDRTLLELSQRYQKPV